MDEQIWISLSLRADSSSAHLPTFKWHKWDALTIRYQTHSQEGTILLDNLALMDLKIKFITFTGEGIDGQAGSGRQDCGAGRGGGGEWCTGTHSFSSTSVSVAVNDVNHS